MALTVEQLNAKYGYHITDTAMNPSANVAATVAPTPPTPIDYAQISVMLLIVLIVIAFIILIYVKRLNGARHGTL